MPDPEQEPASHQRSPVDVLHLVVAALAFLACLTLAVGAENTMVGIEADLLRLVDRLPSGLADFLVGLVQLVALVTPLVAVAVVLVLRRFRLAALVITVPLVAAVLEALLASGLDRLQLPCWPRPWPSSPGSPGPPSPARPGSAGRRRAPLWPARG